MSSLKCLNKYWVENPYQLFCRFYDILPLSGATIENQFNALTRLIILISIVVMLFQFDQGIFLLLSSIIIITVIYYIERYFTNNTSEFNQTCTNCVIEHFTEPLDPILREDYEFDGNVYKPKWMEYNLPSKQPTLAPLTVHNPQIPPSYINAMRYPNSNRFCDKEINMNFTQGAHNQNFLSNNQALAMQGTSVVHERTKIPPVVVPPPTDPEWFVNNLYTRSCVNADSPMDPNLSGYNLQNTPASAPAASLVEYPVPVLHQMQRNPIINYQPKSDLIIEPFSAGHASPSVSYKLQNSAGPDTKLYEQPSGLIQERPNFGKTLDGAGYNPSQLQNYLPSNVDVGPLPRSGILNDFNKNLITQSLQPGIYSRNAVIEPTSSNIGISFTQQLQPRIQNILDGGVMYERHDGRVYTPQPPLPSRGSSAPDDVYDPRQSGYGTAYRTYVDPFSGSAKMYYDDVDDVRRPKFILRSNVDTLIPEQSNNFYDVDNTFRSMTENHRMDISERAMEKINNNNYYKRLAPRSRAAPYNFKS